MKHLTHRDKPSAPALRTRGLGRDWVVSQSFTGSALAALVKGLPEALERQFEYEDPVVRGGKQLLHSPFFKVTLTRGEPERCPA